MKRGGNGVTGARVAASKGMSFSKSPVLAVSLPTWRSRVVLFVLFASFLTLGLRAVYVQAVTDEFLQEKGKDRYQRTIDLPATRGKIMDRNGQVLASSLPVKAVWAIPEDVLKSPPQKLRKLAALLEMSDAELRKKLDSDRTFVYLKRQVEMDVIAKINALKIAGLDTRKEYKRFYPQGEVMTHLVGFTNVEDAGQESIELAQQKNLVGVRGSRLRWLRAATASILSQIVDTLLFVTIAFYGVFPIGELLMGQMLAKVLLSALLVPPLIYAFVSLGRKLDR